MSPGQEAWSIAHSHGICNLASCEQNLPESHPGQGHNGHFYSPKVICQAQGTPTAPWTGWASVTSGFVIIFSPGPEVIPHSSAGGTHEQSCLFSTQRPWKGCVLGMS